MDTVKSVTLDLRSYANPEKAELAQRFFKTGSGQYGEGDKFLGVTTPHIRLVAKKHRTLSLCDVATLLTSEWHEDRSVALHILVLQFTVGDGSTQKAIYNLYLSSTSRINNWDLVDLSARDIVGAYLYGHPQLLPALDSLAESELLWDRRIAIISTFYFLTKGDPEPTIRISKALLNDKEDLMHKAVGWMLRELGKRVDSQLLVAFIKQNYDKMPRTTLRYAIEHFDAPTRKRYLLGKF